MGVKKAVIILAGGFEEIEAVTPADVLRRGGVEVTLAGLGGTTVLSKRGLSLNADTSLEDLGGDYDACILPGGMPGAANLASSDKVTSLVKSMNARGRIIAAICAAPAVVLAGTGILAGRAATCFPGEQDKFGKDTKYRDEPVVCDGNIITSQGPGTALSFSLKILEALRGREISCKVAAAMLAKPDK
ncbi:MAG: DJ-1/PfpI family protein [Elusimicrobia bacterium]|nr:DJ-1/PfpI family protein [Elusimicrobiota bacterium]